MPLHLERIDWMPSPPLAPDDGPIDIEHLKRMTLGDASLEREVLAMFSGPGRRPDRHPSLPCPPMPARWPHPEGLGAGDRAFGVADAAECLEARCAMATIPLRRCSTSRLPSGWPARY